MSIPAYGALGQPTKTRFVDVAPGSTINVRDRRGGVDPFTAVVLEVKPEYGPTSIPAILASVDNQDPIIITDSGKWEIQVVTDGRVLASTERPTHLLRARKKPIEINTIRFEGGTASAVEIIRWAGGKAVIRWAQATQESTEALEIVTLEGIMRAEIGDWIIEGVKGEFYPCKPDVFVDSYDLANAVVIPQGVATPSLLEQLGQQGEQPRLVQ